jgi:exodeoxyribonuclease VII small subunit
MSEKNNRINQIEKLDFEAALEQLEDIIENIETSKHGLEQAIEDYEYAILLKKHLNKKLTDAKLKINKITESGISPVNEIL